MKPKSVVHTIFQGYISTHPIDTVLSYVFSMTLTTLLAEVFKYYDIDNFCIYKHQKSVFFGNILVRFIVSNMIEKIFFS